jgi:hypothetical protein
MNATTDRFTAGIVAALATEVVVSLVVGCVYSIYACCCINAAAVIAM